MKYPKYKYYLLFFDLSFLLFSFVSSNVLRFGTNWIYTHLFNYYFFSDLIIFILFCFVTIFLFHSYSLYKINVFLTRAEQLIKIFFVISIIIICIASFSFFVKQETGLFSSRLGIFYFGIITLFSLSLFRLIFFPWFFNYFLKYETFTHNLLIVGASKIGKLLAVDSILNSVGLKLVGFIDDDFKKGDPIFNEYCCLGNLNDLEKVCEEKNVDDMIICLDNVPYHILLDMIYRGKMTNRLVKVTSPLFGIVEDKLFLEKYGDIPMIGIINYKPSTIDMIIKRVFDFTMSLIGTILLVPLFIVVGVLIKLDSKGPILFKQIRIGKNGKEFLFYKFRTMVKGGDDENNREKLVSEFIEGKSQKIEGSTKIVDESKVTGIGKILRKTSLDELPQLFNVLKGDMSLVGPRPCLPYEWQHYEDWHKTRLSVIPGCTGVWQVTGRSNVNFQNMVILDLYYIYNYSLFLDLQLILKTFPVMLFGKGAK